jgi:hypothetical protein
VRVHVRSGHSSVFVSGPGLPAPVRASRAPRTMSAKARCGLGRGEAGGEARASASAPCESGRETARNSIVLGFCT